MELRTEKTFGYVRVSTDHQTNENQKMAILKFCDKNGIKIDDWIEETVSGAKKVDKRKLGRLLEHVKNGDMIISTEISRLGRSLFMVMEILNICMEKGVKVWTIKDNYRLGDGIESKVLAFAFGLAAEIERKMISERTKQGLARVKASGVVLGRPVGRKSSTNKLDKHAESIQKWLDERIPVIEIARRLNVNRATVSKFISEKSLIRKKSYSELFYESGAQNVKDDLAAGKTITQIATTNNVSFTLVADFVKKNKLANTKKKQPVLANANKANSLDGKHEQIQKMLGSGSTQKEIAAYFSVTPAAISYWLKKNGLNYKRTDKLEGKQFLIAGMLLSGKTYGWIAQKLNVATPTVSAFIRKHKLDKFKEINSEESITENVEEIQYK